MPNPIKYSTGTESDALRKGNFHIGTGSVGKGPSDVTGYYQAVSPVSGGYVIYMNKEGAPGGLSYHSAANDSELITFTNNLAGQSYTGVNECFDYYYGQTDKVLVNQDYPADYPYIVMDGLILNLDAGITQSYPGSGTAWTDINGLGPKNNGTLINGTSFDSSNGGCLSFDGSDDYVSIPNSNLWAFGQNGTVTMWSYFDGERNTNNRWWCTNNNQSSLDAYLATGNRFGLHGSATLTTTEYPRNQWVFVTVTYINGVIKVYFNGINQPLQGKTTDYNITNNTQTLFIGKYVDPNGYRWRGEIASMSIYNKGLIESEVLQNYNAQKGRFGL